MVLSCASGKVSIYTVCRGVRKLTRFVGIDSNYYVEFSTTAEAILCLESHALRPFQVLGRKVRVNFAPPLDGPMHGQVFKRIIWDENAGEQFTYAPDPVE